MGKGSKERPRSISYDEYSKRWSKGDKPRPLSVSYDEYSKRWEAIFSNKEEEEEEKEPCPCGEDECCE